MSRSIALVADIGGTHARFALADTDRATPLLIDSVQQLAVADFASLLAAAQHYLADNGRDGRPAGSGVFAVAGRVEGDEARITNHPWHISRPAMAAALRLDDLQLINDFKAQALATGCFANEDLIPIGGGPLSHATAAERTFAVVGPGTGLGVSAVIQREGISIALETEGGHVGFAPSTAEEVAILAILSDEFGRVSNERLLSGSGLSNIHRALCCLSGDPQALAQPPRAISAGALAGDALCQRAVNVFCEVFGSIAGDLVLTMGAWDGVFLSGGLVPRLLAPLQASAFRQRFEAKGRFADSMARVPSLAVIHPQAGLLGAAALAAQRARG